MTDRMLDSYAGVILSAALSIRRGQRLWIRSEPVHSGFVELLTAKAYDMGAEHVEVTFSDPVFDRIRIDRTGDESFLDYVPGYTADLYRSVVEEGWRALALRGPANPDCMEGADPARLGRMTKASSTARRGFLRAISSNRIPWNVCLLPTEAWAGKVLGSRENWEERIWDVLIPILRLDSTDPAAMWREHDQELKRRCDFLNGGQFSAFRFTGPGTDLVVGMHSDRIFRGGSCGSADGTVFFPNIPTEEVFSTPHMDLTEGRAACTRPVTVLGAQVEGAWFQFSGGRVTDCGAETNADVLYRYLETDQGASRLGEIALVGTDSPIYRSGLIFHNILFDENAACHIALGNGYTDCIERGTAMSPEELSACGCNQSLVHTDFMIGGDQVDVTGITPGGGETVIIEKGRFAV